MMKKKIERKKTKRKGNGRLYTYMYIYEVFWKFK